MLADVHVDAAAEPGSWKCYDRAEARLRTALADADRMSLDAVVVAGDLTRDGQADAFDAFDAVFEEFDRTPLCVPGNHDVPKDYRDAPAVDAFAERYTPGTLPYVDRVGAVDVVGLDSASAVTDGSDGGVADRQIEWLDAALLGVGEAVVVLHHNLSPQEAHASSMCLESHPVVGNAGPLARTLAAHDVPLVLSGHAHWPTVGVVSGVREVVAPAVCSFPQAGLLLSVGPRGTTVSLLPLADREGLEAAYRAARRGPPRSRRIAANFREGYLEGFPLVDERRGDTTESVADV